MPASLVIGQADFIHHDTSTNQTGLYSPYGLAFDASGNLWVADMYNNRVLMFKPPFSSGMAVSLVIGQTDFISRLTNGGNETNPTQTGLDGPAGLVFDGSGNLWVADFGNNRVLMFAGSSGLTGFLLQLQAGWNLISLPVVPLDGRPAQLLKALIQLNELTVVWGYSAGPKAGWQYFTPTGTSTLTSMVDGQAYWIYVRTPVNITITGYVIPPGSAPAGYSLVVGWNLVGFKPQPVIQNETIARYLTTISGDYQLIWVYNNTNKQWIQGSDSLQLAPGQAMWILMTKADTLVPQ